MDLSKKVSFSIHDTFSMVDQESFFLNCKLMRIMLLSHWPENAKKYFPGLRAMNIPSLLTKTDFAVLQRLRVLQSRQVDSAKHQRFWSEFFAIPNDVVFTLVVELV